MRPRVYADGSALSRYLDGAPCRQAWLAWAREHEDRLVTTFLGVSELRRVARPRGVRAHGVAHDVGDRVEVLRFSDQSLHAAAAVANVLPSFVALHVGAAVAHAEVGTVATYDVQLAQIAVLLGLDVVSPGWPDRWWERAV
ncbi:PIN domain-containing protein [Cellulomonas fimi]|nr:PIN domain-containing protein [Cellulomonas fimi]